MVSYGAEDLGNILGSNITKTNEVSQGIVATEEVSNLNIVALETVKVLEAQKVTKKFVTGCDISGVNTGLDPFVLDHPVNGNIDSSDFYIDGTWCSTTVVQDNTGDL